MDTAVSLRSEVEHEYPPAIRSLNQIESDPRKYPHHLSMNSDPG